MRKKVREGVYRTTWGGRMLCNAMCGVAHCLAVFDVELYAMDEGGFLRALWKMAEASQVGLEMDFSKVPIRQETIEICEIFDINPYKLNSEGAVLIGIPAGEALVQELRRMGMMAAVIGQTNAGNDRILYYNGNGRYLERPAKDEIYKILP